MENVEQRSDSAKVLDSVPFKSFLETAPTIRELLQDFYCSRYASCLDHLARLKVLAGSLRAAYSPQPQLELDFFFSEHVNFLFDKIRAKAIVQYFSPFVSVNLNTMADALKTNVPALEKELSRLIMEGQISARIDSHNKVCGPRRVITRVDPCDRSCMHEPWISATQPMRRLCRSVMKLSARPRHYCFA